jgi:hypothetical protein
MDKIIGEQVTFQIEVEENPPRLLLVFDRKYDYAIVPWDDAIHLADVMERAWFENQALFPIRQTQQFVEVEQAQIKLAHHYGLVALLVTWTDRLSFQSADAWLLVARAIKKSAQDSMLERKGIHISYDRQGMISKIHNSQTGTTQKVR